MIVDVTWDGVTLAKGATARAEAGGWFVELEQPMPVGTTLSLAGEATGTVKVARVHEGVGAGMLVRAVGALVTNVPEAVEPAEPSVATDAPAAAATDAAAGAPAGDDQGEGEASAQNGGGKRKRRNTKPRVNR